MLANIIRGLKRVNWVQRYPSADRNASFWRLARQALPLYLRRDGYSRQPLSVFLTVNGVCNLHCNMCDIGTMDENSMFFKNLSDGKGQDLPYDGYRAIIDEVKPFKPFISIPTTEPLLYRPIVDAIAYTRDAGLRINVCTNGLLLPKKADDLVRAGLSKIVLSLDGPPSVHNAIRGNNKSFEQVIEGILALHDAKKQRGTLEPFIYVNYVISDVNYNTLVPMVQSLPMQAIHKVDFRVMFYCTKELADKHNKKWGKDYDATTVGLTGGLNMKNVDPQALHNQLSQVLAMSPEKCQIFFKNDPLWLGTYYHDAETFLDGTKCIFPWFTAQISNTGEMIGPARCFHIPYGNVLKDGFLNVWNAPPLRKFRRDLQLHGRFDACARCEGVNY